nr:uncharacterized protein LOC105327631 isoform X2 [Crassostrea gigas]
MASKRVVIVAIDGSDHAYDALDWYLSNIHRSGDMVIGVHCADYSKLQSQPLTLLSSDKSLVTNFLDSEETSVKKVAATFDSKVLKNKNMDLPSVYPYYMSYYQVKTSRSFY